MRQAASPLSPPREREGTSLPQIKERLGSVQSRLQEPTLQESIADLRPDLVRCLRQQLLSLKEIACVVTSAEYLERQKAQDIASLYEQIGLFSLRLLQASQASLEEEASDS